MSVFLSYSHLNEPEAAMLGDQLERVGINCFRAQRALRGGQRFSDVIKEKIREQQEFFLLATPEALKSEWVIHECSVAWALQKTIVPILLRCERKDLPSYLRDLHYRDFYAIDRVIEDYRQREREASERRQRQRESPDRRLLKEISTSIETLVLRRLGTHSTIYDERTEHYKQEKEALARNVTSLLEARVKSALARGYQKVRIFLDSGTTVAPIFDELGERSSKGGEEFWLGRHSSKVEVITNNIRGLQNLLRFRAKTMEADRYPEIPFDCTVLPGKVLAVYQAIADQRTVEAILYLAQSDRSYNLSVVTGNYVLCTSDGLVLPVARAGFHPEIKSVLYAVSDEVLLLAPLGKIVRGGRAQAKGLRQLLSQLNSDLKYSEGAQSPSQVPYRLIEEATIEPFLRPMDRERWTRRSLADWSAKTVVVTTKRKDKEHVFFPHYRELTKVLTRFKIDARPCPSHGPYLAAGNFDELPYPLRRQIETEVPHKNMRIPALIKKYFGVLIPQG